MPSRTGPDKQSIPIGDSRVLVDRGEGDRFGGGADGFEGAFDGYDAVEGVAAEAAFTAASALGFDRFGHPRTLHLPDVARGIHPV